jgi:toxin ParE1/3/4
MTAGARKDLRGLHEYIATHDSYDKANYVVENILRVITTLKELPMRGVHSAELLTLGNRNYREVFFKPYRIVYRVHQTTVYIALIADGRRDMSSLLSSRVMEP